MNIDQNQPAAGSDDFAAEMSGLLLGIQGCVSLLLKETATGGPGYDQLRQIQEGVRRGTLLIERLHPGTGAAPGEGSRPLAGEIVPGAETILLVDDDEAIIDVTRDMLEIMGYRVLAATSGRDAIRICQERGTRIDLVLLDMILVDMDGGEIFDRLQAIRPGLAIILASGFGLNQQVSQVMAKGCRAFLQKPFGMAELSQKVRGVLEGG